MAESVSGEEEPEEQSDDDEDGDRQEDVNSIRIDEKQASSKEKSRQDSSSVAGLILDIDRGVLLTQPFFQRGYVWSHTLASTVIETLLLNNPLPEVWHTSSPVQCSARLPTAKVHPEYMSDILTAA